MLGFCRPMLCTGSGAIKGTSAYSAEAPFVMFMICFALDILGYISHVVARLEDDARDKSRAPARLASGALLLPLLHHYFQAIQDELHGPFMGELFAFAFRISLDSFIFCNV
jgi:hypothetical protein